MTQVSKPRLNTEIRKKIGGIILSHFENEQTPELEAYKSAREDITVAYDRAFKLATSIVQRAYPKDDVNTLLAFKKKYGSACDVVAKDSCFYFARPTVIDDEENVSEHFDFKLNASLTGRYDDSDFAIAYFRDELKSAGLNPEINVIHQNNGVNPHHSQESDKIRKFFNFSDENSIGGNWKSKYSLNVIGTSYCRSRTIPCMDSEFEQMKAFKNAREVFVKSHFTWAEAIQKDMKDITLALKDYKYIKDAIDLCGALGLDINEGELQRTAGVSLTIYQPENLASLIKSRRAKQDNKSVIAQFKKARQTEATVN